MCVIVMSKNGKTIWVTSTEFTLLCEGKELFQAITGVKLSWGAYLTALSFGALAAKTLSGLLIRCPECGSEVEMMMIKPTIER